MSRRATVDTARLLEVVRAEAELVVSTARNAAPDAQVPACPGLRLGETVRHLGGMYRATLAWIRTGERPTSFTRQPDNGQSVTSFLEEGLAELLAELEAHAPLDSCATWWPQDETYGFWCRRMAHETTVHRIDVQGAARVEPTPVAADIALDGVDEVLTLWFGRRLETLGLSGNRHASVEVRSGGRRWLAVATPEGTSAQALGPIPGGESGSGDSEGGDPDGGGTGGDSGSAAWRTPEELAADTAQNPAGPADASDPADPSDAEGLADSDNAGAPAEPAPVGSGATVTSDPELMYLWLWGRRPLYGGAVTVTGDDDAVAQLWALLRLATR